MQKRSAYIPIPKYPAEAILAQLCIDFPWIIGRRTPTERSAVEMAESLQELLREFISSESHGNKRVARMLIDRAEFGAPPKGYTRREFKL